MTITTKATYENGLLRPEQPLPIPEGTQVELTVTPPAQPPAGDAEGDPLEGLIGICDEGPPISLAARHDEIVYGLKLDDEP